jgi:hypothetical protein
VPRKPKVSARFEVYMTMKIDVVVFRFTIFTTPVISLCHGKPVKLVLFI